MNGYDRFGNNPLHKACRFRNPQMLQLLLQKDIGNVGQRNNNGKLPFEMPHNDILNALSIKKVVLEYKERYPDIVDKYIVLEKEPDYIFIVDKERRDVLTD